jgi:hypothetical protein
LGHKALKYHLGYDMQLAFSGLVYPGYESRKFHRNIGDDLLDYTISRPIKQ